MKYQRLLLAAALLAAAAPALAHHGTAGSYAMGTVVRVEGVVKEFRWRNPHSSLFVVGRDASGREVTYALEMGSPNTLSKLGYSRNAIKVGDKALVEMHPSIANPTNGYAPSALRMIINGKQINTVVREGAP
jgi:hypothetical protein